MLYDLKNGTSVTLAPDLIWSYCELQALYSLEEMYHLCSMKGICKLCCKNEELIDSHIIPQFLYKPVLDGNLSTTVVQEDKMLYESRLRTGIYDEEILCAACDQLINKYYDDYGAKVWNGYRNLNIDVVDYYDKNDPRIEWREAKNADAERFKTFLLSILWRAHISTHEFFDSVDLGKKHSSIIKNHILDRTPAIEYEIILGHYTINNPEPRGFISSINHYRKEGKHYYSAMIAGIQIHWFISKGGVSEGLKFFTINSINGLKIFKSPRQGFEAIKHFIGEETLRMPKTRTRKK